MKSDNAIWNGTGIFVGIIVVIAAFVRGALLLPLLLVACSVWGLYVLHHLRGSLPAVPKKKAKAPRRAKFVVPDIEDEPLSDILLLHVNQRILYKYEQVNNSNAKPLFRSRKGGFFAFQGARKIFSTFFEKHPQKSLPYSE